MNPKPGESVLHLIVNGERLDFAEEAKPGTLGCLVAKLGFSRENVVAEVNGAVVRNEQFDAFSLDSGDRLELVHFVGGG